MMNRFEDTNSQWRKHANLIIKALFRRILCIRNISRRRGAENRACCLMAYDRTFKQKLQNGKKFEVLVKNCMENCGYQVEYVPLDKQHNGDLYLTDILTRESFYLEVKQDTYIAITQNFYVELEIKRGDKRFNGWYHYNYDKIAVVDAAPKSQTQREYKSIYIIDWGKMKAELKKDDDRCRLLKHPIDGNTNTALLVPLKYIVSRGWLVKECYYDVDDWNKARKESTELQQIGV